MNDKIRESLGYALQDLEESSFKSLRHRLNNLPLNAGWHSIPRSVLQDRDREETTDYIIRYNTVIYAPEIVLWVLEKINERQVRLELRDRLKEVGYYESRMQDKQIQTSPDPGSSMKDAPSCSKTQTTDATTAHKHLKRGNGHLYQRCKDTVRCTRNLAKELLRKSKLRAITKAKRQQWTEEKTVSKCTNTQLLTQYYPVKKNKSVGKERPNPHQTKDQLTGCSTSPEPPAPTVRDRTNSPSKTSTETKRRKRGKDNQRPKHITSRRVKNQRKISKKHEQNVSPALKQISVKTMQGDNQCQQEMTRYYSSPDDTFPPGRCGAQSAKDHRDSNVSPTQTTARVLRERTNIQSVPLNPGPRKRIRKENNVEKKE